MVVPFRLQVEFDGAIIELICSRVLRVLPGKRLICFGEWNGQHVLVKIFLNMRRGKHHCAREERGVRALQNSGIKTPELMFKGVLMPDSTPVLGFQRIIPARNLAEAWKQGEDGGQCSGMMIRVVALIADQHKAGLKQEDLHPGNFLLSEDDIYTIDGGAIDARQMGKSLSQENSLKNLGLFFAQFFPRFDHLIPEIFHVYIEKRGWSTQRGLFPRLMKEVRYFRNQRKSQYLKKVYRECSAFVCKKTWCRFMVCDRRFYDESMARFLDAPDTVIESGRLLKDGNSSTVALVEVGGERMVVKRYNIKNARHALKRCPRRSRAWVSWRNAHLLLFLGIRTPKPIVFFENRWGPLRSRAYFVTEYVDGIDAYDLFRSDGTMENDREGLLEQFGELLQLLADASISHGDFKATNFIVAREGLFLTDLDGMREHRSRSQFRPVFRRDCERLMKNWEGLTELTQQFRNRLSSLDL